ncbi:MAG: helix-turn-helix transcriptional regulator, partial [Lachnospiraceae bacterium]|nr:helix-turn-helix transcriptional regulator [Lachnospiraceae bacterium]
MDTKKIGAFLKQCRKEKNLTQEQLAEKFEVSARTVSRWETGINMPDLSILVQLAEYYDVEIRELLDGERSQTMNKEMKETLDKVAVYEEWVKQKALKAGNLAFASMLVISVLAIIIQMLLTVDIRLVLGETATALVGGILYASIMVYNGIWDKCLPKSATIWRDFFTSVICAGIFTVIYGICLFRMGATETQVTRLAVGFLIGITIVAFIVLRLLAFINRKRNQNSSNVQEKKETSISKAEWTKIYNAQNIVETEQLVEMLKQNGIAAFSQEAGANVAMHGAPGFGIYGV